ncbi:MAG: hypothetical protein EBX37_17285 [Alphaproteobacteria bacterium]|nr:hypothetical protein [Alphaproteobacteria bacterium]
MVVFSLVLFASHVRVRVTHPQLWIVLMVAEILFFFFVLYSHSQLWIVLMVAEIFFYFLFFTVIHNLKFKNP